MSEKRDLPSPAHGSLCQCPACSSPFVTRRFREPDAAAFAKTGGMGTSEGVTRSVGEVIKGARAC